MEIASPAITPPQVLLTSPSPPAPAPRPNLDADPIADALAKLKVTPRDQVLLHGGGANGEFGLKQLKAIAVHLGLSNISKLSKAALYDTIMNSLTQQQELDELGIGGPAVRTSLRLTSWHIIRIINCIFWEGEEQLDALQTSSALATRTQLQHNETGAGHPVWVNAAQNFNNNDYHSGGIRVEELRELPMFEDINPESDVDFTIEPAQLKKTFNACKKDYIEALARWTASGKHHGDSVFKEFTYGKAAPVYLFFVLKELGNPELNSFMEEGATINGGIDTTSNVATDDDNSSRVRRKRSKTDNKGIEMMCDTISKFVPILGEQNQQRSSQHRDPVEDMESFQRQIAQATAEMNSLRKEIRREKALADDGEGNNAIEVLEEQYADAMDEWRRLKGYLRDAHSKFHSASATSPPVRRQSTSSLSSSSSYASQSPALGASDRICNYTPV